MAPSSARPSPLLSTARPWFRVLAGLAVAATCIAGAGCQIFHSEAGGVLTATSTDGSKSLAPDFKTAAYFGIDGDTADVYLSDIPAERFENPRDRLADATGSIVHVHLFLIPEAGQTPIDTTACNVTVRQLVLAGPSPSTRELPIMGLYAGGGFLLPNGTIGSGSIGGTINGASQRMTRSTPEFKDLIGTSTISGKFGASQDDVLAQAMAAKLEWLVSKMPQANMAGDDADLRPLPVKKAPEKKDKKKAGEEEKKKE